MHRALRDDRHPAQPGLVAGVGLAHVVEEVVVDPVDDLEVPRQQPPEHLDRPHLERLGQQRVTRVGEALLRHGPGIGPVEALLVDEDPHELRDRDDGVGVVELEDDPVGELVQVEVLRQHLVDEVVQRAGHEEVLLLEPQLLALWRRVLRVEDHRDLLGEGLVADRLDVVAGVEDLEVERPGRLGAPQPQRVDAAVAVARDHVVVGHAEDVPVADPAGALGAVLVLGRLREAAELDGDGVLRVRELPRVAELQPRVGLLDLPAVLEGLPEDAVLVADAVAHARDRHRRERVDEARREPAETAVAEARLDLLRAQRGQRDAELPETLLDDGVEVGGEDRVVQLPAEEVLRRQVADGLGLLVPLLGQRRHPPRLQVVAHRAGEREVLVVDRAAGQADALPVVQLAHEVADEGLDGMPRSGEVSAVQPAAG